MPRDVIPPSVMSELPDATASFVEACAKLALDAVARGDRSAGEVLLEKAARAAALRGLKR